MIALDANIFACYLLNDSPAQADKKLRISIEGEIATIIDRIMAKPRDKVNKALLQDPDGQ